MFSPDFTQVGFDNDAGKLTFDVIEQGFKSGFWDSKYMNMINEHDAYTLFGKGNVAMVRWSESPILDATFAAHQGVRQHPGATPGTTGSTGGPDGLGVSKFSKNPDACWSWSKANWSDDVCLAAATTIKDSTGALILFPVARTSIVANPAVVAAQPLQPVYEAQHKGSTNSVVDAVRHHPGVQRRDQQDDQRHLHLGPGARRRGQGLPGHHHQVPERLTSATPVVRNTQGRGKPLPCVHVRRRSLGGFSAAQDPRQPVVAVLEAIAQSAHVGVDLSGTLNLRIGGGRGQRIDCVCPSDCSRSREPWQSPGRPTASHFGR